MSLWDLTPCDRDGCEHARHLHRTIDTKQGKKRVHCSRCSCPEYVEPPLRIIDERRAEMGSR